MASISWSSIEHSVETGDYVLAVVLLSMIFYIIGQFFVDRWRPEHNSRVFHPTRPWKLPYTTTPRGLWLRVGYRMLIASAIYSGLASVLVIGTTAEPEFMVLLGSLLLLRIPHLYWSMRGRYEIRPAENAARSAQTMLRYRGGSDLHGRAFWLIPTLLAAVGAFIATVGVLLH